MSAEAELGWLTLGPLSFQAFSGQCPPPILPLSPGPSQGWRRAGEPALCTGVWLHMGMREARGLHISPFLDLGGGGGGVRCSPRGALSAPEDRSSLSALSDSLHPPSHSTIFLFRFLSFPSHPCLVLHPPSYRFCLCPPLPFNTLVFLFLSFLSCLCLPITGTSSIFLGPPFCLC